MVVRSKKDDPSSMFLGCEAFPKCRSVIGLPSGKPIISIK